MIFIYTDEKVAVKNKLGFVGVNPWQPPSPPSVEGGGFLRKQKVGGREIKPHKTATFSLPQYRFARQLPRQREAGAVAKASSLQTQICFFTAPINFIPFQTRLYTDGNRFPFAR